MSKAYLLVMILIPIGHVGCGLWCMNVSTGSKRLVWEKMAEMKWEVGDVITMKTDRTLWIAESDAALVSIAQARQKNFAKVFTLNPKRLSNPELQAAKINVVYPRGWSKEQAVALIHKLDAKELPYSPRFCHGGHYMRYIIYAELHSTRIFGPFFLSKSCPLERNLKNLPVEAILAEDFYLLNNSRDKNRRQVNVEKDLTVIAPYFEYQRKKPLRLHLPRRHNVKQPEIGTSNTIQIK